MRSLHRWQDICQGRADLRLAQVNKAGKPDWEQRPRTLCFWVDGHGNLLALTDDYGLIMSGPSSLVQSVAASYKHLPAKGVDDDCAQAASLPYCPLQITQGLHVVLHRPPLHNSRLMSASSSKDTDS